jgi:hypothetical protein
MKTSIRYVLAPALGLLLSVTSVIAGPGGGSKDVRSSAKGNVNNASSSRNDNTNKNRNTNVNNNTNVNRNTNVNKNTNVNVNKDVNVNVNNNNHYDNGCCYHSGVGGAVAVAAAATTAAVVTSAVVGARVTTLPPACTVAVVNGVTYQQCGSTWYQPQFSGGSTTYVVINPPR